MSPKYRGPQHAQPVNNGVPNSNAAIKTERRVRVCTFALTIFVLSCSQARNVRRQNGNTVAELTRYNRLLRIVRRLGEVAAGSPEANAAIHEAVGLAGPVKPYTTDEAAARILLPSGFEWLQITYTAGWMYAPCRHAGISEDGLAHPHHGQRGPTIPLSFCGGILRTWATLDRLGEG